MSAKAKIVKSFLRGCTKLCQRAVVCASSSTTMKAKKPRADYTVVKQRCQVFFAGMCKIIYNCASLCWPGPRAHPGIIRAIAAGVKRYLQASANLR